VFVGGDAGTILHWDGSDWTRSWGGNLGSEAFVAIWGSSPSDVYAVSDRGLVLRYDGNAWIDLGRRDGHWFHVGLRGVWGTSPTNVFAVGYRGAILRYDGATWSPVAGWGETDGLRGVWGASSSDVFAAGDRSILHYDGTSWSARRTDAKLVGVWGTSANDVYAVGAQDRVGVVLQYNGRDWDYMKSGVGTALNDLWGTSPSDIYAVGETDAGVGPGMILHYDGSDWTERDVTIPLVAVWGTSLRDVWAVGRGRSILHYDGASWGVMDSGTDAHLFDVWGTSPTDVFAVGSGGTILHYDGTRWSLMESGTVASLSAVWGTSSSDVYAAQVQCGYSPSGSCFTTIGNVLHYDGTSWSVLPGGSSGLHDVWGTSTGDVVMVGDYVILRGRR
jgi:uncharacterized membrane protein